MPPSPLPDNELERLAAVHLLLGGAPNPALDAVTRLAAELCEVPIALITLLDEHRQWFKSALGLDGDGTAREHSFCAHQPTSGRRPEQRALRRFALAANNCTRPKRSGLPARCLPASEPCGSTLPISLRLNWRSLPVRRVW